MVLEPGGTVASASDWLTALPVGTPASSRMEEPSAVMKDGRSSSRAVCTAARVAAAPAAPGRPGRGRAVPFTSGSRHGAAGGLLVQPAGDARDGVGHVPAYGRRLAASWARYAARDGPEAVCGDGVGVDGVVERVHRDSLVVMVWWLGAARPQAGRSLREARAAFPPAALTS